MQLGGYIFPDISTITTSLLQEQALQTLREIAVVSFKKLSDKTWRIRRIMSQNIASNNSTQHHLASNNNNTSDLPTLAGHNYQGSAAEQTITEYTNPGANQSDRPLTKRNNGKFYTTNPTNGYISNWEDGFKDVWVVVTHSIALLLVLISKNHYLDKYSGKSFGHTSHQLELGSVIIFHNV